MQNSKGTENGSLGLSLSGETKISTISLSVSCFALKKQRRLKYLNEEFLPLSICTRVTNNEICLILGSNMVFHAFTFARSQGTC